MRSRALAVTSIGFAAIVGVSLALAAVTDSSAAEWLAAAGTVLAVAVALFISLDERWRRPELKLVTGAEKPWWNNSKQGGQGDFALRVQVCNDDKVPATNVRVRCELFELGRRSPEGGALTFGLPDLVTGISLPWYEGGVLAKEATVDLAPGASRYALAFKMDSRSVYLPEPGPVHPLADAYRMVITVVSDQSLPLRTALLLAHRGASDPYDVSISFVTPSLESDPRRDPTRTRRVTFGS